MLGLLNHDKLLVGYDIGDDYAQISYAFSEDGDVETLSSVAGEQRLRIPAVLCKRPGVNQWLFGKEALRCEQEEEGIAVRELLAMAIDGEPVKIDGESYEPVSLLTLFVKKTLGLLSQLESDKIYAMTITCESLDARRLEVLSGVVSGLLLKTDRVSFQSYEESYYNYMLYQPEELWTHQSLLCDYRGGRIFVYHLECNRHTTPNVVFVDKKEYPFPAYENMPEDDALREQRMERLDREFLEIAEDACRNRRISSVYLIGENFSEDWMKESLRSLCRGRRVFQGNNLYSKGACFGRKEKLKSSEAGKNHVFLGEDKLRANIGMKLLRQGEESYAALLDAGQNWFEASQTLEFYLQGGNCFDVTIMPLMEKNGKVSRIILEELDGELTRLRAHFFMTAANRMAVEIEDLGLGELRPSKGHVWKEEMEVYQA